MVTAFPGRKIDHRDIRAPLDLRDDRPLNGVERAPPPDELAEYSSGKVLPHHVRHRESLRSPCRTGFSECCRVAWLAETALPRLASVSAGQRCAPSEAEFATRSAGSRSR